jgi:hypothetical protein
MELMSLRTHVQALQVKRKNSSEASTLTKAAAYYSNLPALCSTGHANAVTVGLLEWHAGTQGGIQRCAAPPSLPSITVNGACRATFHSSIGSQ